MIALEDSRKKIDEIDSQLMKLFEERMNTVVDIALYKKVYGMEIFQSDREKLVIEKNLEKIENKNLNDYAEQFLMDLMKISKKYQSDMIEEK